jgi:uncharacterized protein (TIGR03083 family)
VDPGRTGEAVLAQADLIAGWLSGQRPSAWRKPSALPGWTVTELAGHIATALRNVPATLGQPTGDRPRSVADYLAGYAEAADEIREREVKGASGRAPDEVLADLYDRRDAAARALADLPATRAVRAPRGPMSPADYLVTLAIEVVVHADDLSRSLPDTTPVELDRTALRIVTQALADVLAARAPGRSLELRVPPYAAVQAVEGPRHTRGTPPSVVETDPLTWVRLAAGRLRWTDAGDHPPVQASGERADLGRWLPLL